MVTAVDDFELIYEKLNDEQKKVLDLIGEEAFKRLIVFINGDNLYVPSVASVSRAARNKSIKNDFNGYNFRELAKKYGLNPRSIRGIVKDITVEKRNKPLEGQLSWDDIE